MQWLALDGGPAPGVPASITAPQFGGDALLLDPATGTLWERDRQTHQWAVRPAPEPVQALSDGLLIRGGDAYQQYPPYANLGPAVAVSSGCVLRADAGVDCQGVRMPLAARSISAASTLSRGCAATVPGSARCWTHQTDGGVRVTPALTTHLFVRQVEGTDGYGCALGGANAVQCWGRGPSDIPIPELVRSIYVGWAYGCALSVSGRLWCWGDNAWGQLGVPVTLDSLDFVKVTY
jgi:hypothetical protein